MTRLVEIIHPDGTVEQGEIPYSSAGHGKNANPSYRRDYFKYPERIRARRMVRQAIKKGTLVRPLVCEDCGGTSKHVIQAHHEDYDKPLDVRWLCTTCHRIADKSCTIPG